MSSLELAGAESKIKQAIALKQEQETRQKTKDWQRSAYIYCRGDGARGKTNRGMANELSKLLKGMWGKDAVVQIVRGRRGHMQPQKGIDISITGHGAVTLHRSATEKYTQKMTFAKLVEKLKADYNYDKKTEEPVKTMPKVGRTGKIFIRGNPRNFATASEIRMALMGLWGVPESNIDIISGKHGRKPSTANVEITIQGNGVIYLHASSDFPAAKINRADLMTKLGYTYGQTPKKQPVAAKPTETVAVPSQQRLVCTVNGFSFTVDHADMQTRCNMRGVIAARLNHNSANLPGGIYDNEKPGQKIHAQLRGDERGWLIGPVEDLPVVPLSDENAVNGVWNMYQRHLHGDDFFTKATKPQEATKRALIIVGETDAAKARAKRLSDALEAEGYTTCTIDKKIVSPDHDIVISCYDLSSSVYVHGPHRLSGQYAACGVSTLIEKIKELNKKPVAKTQVDPVVVEKAGSAGIPAGPLTTNKPVEVDHTKLPESRYVCLVDYPVMVSAETRKLIGKNVLDLTGEYPANSYSTSSVHEDTKVVISVYDEKIANVSRFAPDSGSNVYYDEVAARVKKLLDESGAPYAKAEKKAPTAEEPTKQYVYVHRRAGKLPDGAAYTSSVSMAVTKKQRERLIELAGDKPIGTFLRENTLKTLKID